MDEEIERLVVSVRADTGAFARDVAEMRGALDGPLAAGADRAGRAIEAGLLRAVRTGKLGFEDLRRIALSVLAEIAEAAVRAGIGALGGAIGSGDSARGGGRTGEHGGLLTGLVGLIGGLAGRATGGPVGPGTAYLVGERGPELFVPTASGRVETGAVMARTGRLSPADGPAGGTSSPAAERATTAHSREGWGRPAWVAARGSGEGWDGPTPPATVRSGEGWRRPSTIGAVRSGDGWDRASPMASARSGEGWNRTTPIAAPQSGAGWQRPMPAPPQRSDAGWQRAPIAPAPRSDAGWQRPPSPAPVASVVPPPLPPVLQVREVRVAITVNARSGEAPAALARSSRQVARAVKSALGSID